LNHDVVIIEGENLYLRELTLLDVNETYLRWMNDPEVIRYLECRFYRQSLESLKTYVIDESKNPDSVFLAISLKKNDSHIGNIKIGNIYWNHRLGDVGIVIGNKNAWGKGFASEAIKLIKEHAFFHLNLHKLTAGCYVDNVGSKKAFMKNGFEVEGVWKKHCSFEGDYADVFLLGILNKGYQPQDFLKIPIQRSDL